MNVYDIDSVDIDGTFLDKDSVIECGPSEESCMKNCTSENVEMKMARRLNKGSGSTILLMKVQRHSKDRGLGQTILLKKVRA